MKKSDITKMLLFSDQDECWVKELLDILNEENSQISEGEPGSMEAETAIRLMKLHRIHIHKAKGFVVGIDELIRDLGKLPEDKEIFVKGITGEENIAIFHYTAPNEAVGAVILRRKKDRD